jgi:SAM-dependent methyltransferase
VNDRVHEPLPGPKQLRRLAAYSGDPWTAKHEYFALAEVTYDEVWRTLISPFLDDCDLSSTIDLAAGHGRNSRKLAERADRLLILDIQSDNVATCRRRFSGLPNVTCAKNNGYDLHPAEDEAWTLVFCFDSMVHFEPEVVRSYLRDTRRVLRRGGRGFFHHSNYVLGKDWPANPHARNYMSADLFAGFAEAEGLAVVRQSVFDWGHVPELDCITLVEKR